MKGAYDLEILNLKSKKAATRDLVFGFGDGVHTSLGIVSGEGGVAVTADIVIGIAIGLI